MKVVRVHGAEYKLHFKQNNQMDNLSGIKQIREYDEKINTLQRNKEENEQKLTDVLLNSFFFLNSIGKYDSAKVLFDELQGKSALEKYDDIYILNSQLGDLNKKTGDIQSANEFYKKCNKEMSERGQYDALRLINFKNIYETDFLLGKTERKGFEIFAETNEPLCNMIYLYLNSLYDKKYGNISKSRNEINLAYKIMLDKKLVDDDIIFQKGLSLTDSGMYKESSDILTQRMDTLYEQNQVYTKEFLDYLLLLGINSMHANKDKSEALGMFANAAEIADIMHNIPAKEFAGYTISKILFSLKDTNFIHNTEYVLNSIKNPKYKIRLEIMQGDYYKDLNNYEKSKVSYENAVQMLKEFETDNAKSLLLETYKKLQSVSSDDKYEFFNKEINKLEVEYLYSSQDLLKRFINLYDNQELNDIVNISRNVINSDKPDEICKNIASLYLNLAAIKKGKDLQIGFEQIDNKIKNLINLSNRNAEHNDTVNKALAHIHKAKADIFYAGGRYDKAAEEVNNADIYFNRAAYTDIETQQHKIKAALYNYKARRYYYAEQYTLQYLAVLLGKKNMSSSSPSKITEEISKILTKMYDSEKKKIAAVYETLGVINLKNRNFADSREYFLSAVNIRERLQDRDFDLANSYAALARIAILTGWWDRKISSKDMHSKSLEILRDKYPKHQITQEEEKFHKTYYGGTLASVMKWIKLTKNSEDRIINNFKCYNKELNICE